MSLDTLELELELVVRHVIWVLGSKSGSSAKSVSALNNQTLSPAYFPSLWIDKEVSNRH